MAIGSYGWSFYAQTAAIVFMKSFVGDVPIVYGGCGTKSTDDSTIGGLASIEGATLTGVQITSWSHEGSTRIKTYEARGRWF